MIPVDASHPLHADAERELAAARLRIRGRSPFFATLSLFAPVVLTEAVPAAATDGTRIFVNPGFVSEISPLHLDAILLHEVLHAALLHPFRRRERDRMRWNFAADVVVNGIIAANRPGDLPDELVRVPEWEHLTVEEVYALLLENDAPLRAFLADLVDPGAGEETSFDEAEQAQALAYWEQARQQAETLAVELAYGRRPLGLERELRRLGRGELDWRAILWRFIARTPMDFGDFDRRFIGQGLYLETHERLPVKVAVCIDSSGSITRPRLEAFVGELEQILRTYHRLEVELYFADAALYGPTSVSLGRTPPTPRGGGGTSFAPFFEHLARRSPDELACAVYFTDGFGQFPSTAPRLPVLWVVTPGGLADGGFPFGEVVRMVSP